MSYDENRISDQIDGGLYEQEYLEVLAEQTYDSAFKVRKT